MCPQYLSAETLRKILLLVVVIEYLSIFWLLVILLLGTVWHIQGVKSVKADTFFPDAEVSQSDFFYTLGLGYNDKDIEPEIDYSREELLGSTRDTLVNKRFNDFLQSSGDVYKRVAGSGDSVSVAPGMDVSFLWYPYNNTGHVVKIGKVWLFLGPYNSTYISDIVDVQSSLYRNITYFDQGILLTKGGTSVDLGAHGNFYPTSIEQMPLGKEIYVGKVKQSIHLVSQEYACVRGEANSIYGQISGALQNQSGIEEKVNVGDSQMNISSGEKVVFGPLRVPPDKKELKISVVSRIKRCLGSFEQGAFYNTPDAFPLLATRDDAAHYQWGATILGILPSEDSLPYCVTRIPYEIKVSLPGCVLPPNLEFQADDHEPGSVELKPGKVIKIAAKVRNTGGTMVASDTISVSMPESWQLFLLPAENLSLRKVENGLAIYDYVTRILQENEIQEIDLPLNIPAVVKSNVVLTGIVRFYTENKSRDVNARILADSEIAVTVEKAMCRSNHFVQNIKVFVSGDLEIEKLAFSYKRDDSNSGGNSTVTYRLMTTEVYRTFALVRGGQSDIEIYGMYLPGVYNFLVENLIDFCGVKDDGIAVGKVPARSISPQKVLGAATGAPSKVSITVNSFHLPNATNNDKDLYQNDLTVEVIAFCALITPMCYLIGILLLYMSARHFPKLLCTIFPKKR